MEKTKNPEVKKYLIDTTSQILDNCDVFTRVFGKNFARDSLRRNLKEVYTNGEKEVYEAYYNYEDNTLSIYCEKEEILTQEDIEKDDNLYYKVAHEMGHAVLDKPEEECERNGTHAEIGICIVLNTREGEIIGKGLSEGHIVWMFEKAGLPPRNFKKLTNFIKILELQVGDENIMRLGKGDIEGNIPNQLQMTREDSIDIIKISDHVFDLEQEINSIDEIIDVLMKYRNKIISKSETERKTQLAKAEKELRNNEIYKYYINNSLDYKEYLSENEKENSLDSQLVYLENRNEASRIANKQFTSDFLEKIFEHYFENSIEEAVEAEYYISSSDMKKFDRLYQLLVETTSMDVIYDEDEIYKGTKVQKFIDEIYNKLVDKYAKIKAQINSGNIQAAIEEINSKYAKNLLSQDRKSKGKAFREKLSSKTSIENMIYDSYGNPINKEEEFGESSEEYDDEGKEI